MFEKKWRRGTKVYYRSPTIRIAALGSMASSILGGLTFTYGGLDAMSRRHNMGIIAVLLGLGMFWLANVAYRLAFYVRLVVGPQGVEYYSLFSGCFTTWANIAKVGKCRYPRKTRRATVLSLILDQSATVLTRQHPAHPSKIPIGAFYHGGRLWTRFENTPLGQDIRYYVPHLVDEYRRNRKRILAR